MFSFSKINLSTSKLKSGKEYPIIIKTSVLDIIFLAISILLVGISSYSQPKYNK